MAAPAGHRASAGSRATPRPPADSGNPRELDPAPSPRRGWCWARAWGTPASRTVRSWRSSWSTSRPSARHRAGPVRHFHVDRAGLLRGALRFASGPPASARPARVAQPRARNSVVDRASRAAAPSTWRCATSASPSRARNAWNSRTPEMSTPPAPRVRELLFVFVAVALERHELLLGLDGIALGFGQAFGAFALVARRRPAGRDRAGRRGSRGTPERLAASASANICASARTLSAWPTRSLMPCCRNFCIFGPQRDRRVDARIAAALIGADGDEVAVLLVGRQRLAEAARELADARPGRCPASRG